MWCKLLAVTTSGIILGMAAHGQTPGAQDTQLQMVSGIVESVAGEPVGGAVVALIPSGQTIRQTSWLHGKSAADGSFSVRDVPVGEYRVCVPESTGNVLDPCIWGGFPVRVTVQSASRLGPIKVLVNIGSELALRLSDSNRIMITDTAARGRRPHLMIGVSRPGVPFLPFRLVNETPSNREYRLVVPAGVRLDVSVGSKDYEFEDDPVSGKSELAPVMGGLKAEIEIQRGTARREVLVRVRGRKP